MENNYVCIDRLKNKGQFLLNFSLLLRRFENVLYVLLDGSKDKDDKLIGKDLTCLYKYFDNKKYFMSQDYTYYLRAFNNSYISFDYIEDNFCLIYSNKNEEFNSIFNGILNGMIDYSMSDEFDSLFFEDTIEEREKTNINNYNSSILHTDFDYINNHMNTYVPNKIIRDLYNNQIINYYNNMTHKYTK